ncbi:MAG: hypothetical protein AAF965_04115, partial [Pseudomonadota bacterium]
ADAEAALGGAAGDPDDPLTWQYRINAGSWQALSGTVVAAEAQDIQLRISDSDHPAGSFTATSNTVTVSASITPPVVDSVVVGAFSGNQIPITVTATEAQSGDTLNWTMRPEGGGAAVASGSSAWPGPFTATLADGIANASYEITVQIDNGARSNIGLSNTFMADTVGPVLSSPTAVESAGDIGVSVASDETSGVTVYAAYRLASDPVLSKTNIENGTGNAIASQSGTSSPYSGTFSGPAAGTYRVDYFARGDFGNESAVVSSGDVVISAASSNGIPHLGPGATDQPNSTSPISLGLNMSAHDNAQKVLVGMSTMGFNPGGDIALTSITLDGKAAEQIFESRNPDGISGGSYAAVFPAGAYAASSTLQANFDRSVWRFNASAYDIGASPTVGLLDTQPFSASDNYVLTGAVLADNGVIVVVGTTNNEALNPAVTGATWDDELVGNGGNRLNVGSLTGLVDDASYDVGVTYTSSQGTSALLLRVS